MGYQTLFEEEERPVPDDEKKRWSSTGLGSVPDHDAPVLKPQDGLPRNCVVLPGLVVAPALAP